MDDPQIAITEPTDDHAWRRKQRWSDFSPAQQVAIVMGGTVEVAITTLALRDLARRPAKDIRGWKPLWLLGFVVQPFGPLLYFVVGRRSTR